MKLTEIFRRSKGQKVSLVTNNSDYFLFYEESPTRSGELKFALEKVSDLTKCASLGVIYHFKTIEEAENWLKANYADFEEY